MSLAVALKAFKRGAYQEAIEQLETYCRECDSSGVAGSRDYMQAQLGLIKSYQASGQTERAIEHGQQLATTNNQALKIWLERNLSTLTATPAATAASALSETVAQPDINSAEDLSLLESGLKLLKRGQYAEAITALKEFLHNCSNTQSRNYMQAQMSLVKAYQGQGDTQQAIELCQTLLEADNAALKSWASRTLSSLLPPEASAAEAAEPPVPANTTPESSTTTATSAARSTASSHASIASPSSARVRRSPPAPTPSYSIAGSGASLVGNAFMDSVKETLYKFVVRMLIRRGIGLVFLLALWFLRGCVGDSGTSSELAGDTTPLHLAAGQGNLSEVQKLLNRGADINAQDSQGKTPLFWATSGCVFESADIEQIGCDPTRDHSQVTALLISRGAAINAQDVNQDTPLHWAARYGVQPTAKILLSQGADINAKDVYGDTPLAVAQKVEDPAMVMLLQSYSPMP